MTGNIFNAISDYTRSLKVIRKLKLWKYFLIPMLISLLTAGLIIFSAWSWGGFLGALFSKIWFWEWGAKGFRTVGNFMGALLIIVFGFMMYRHIVMALSAPFMGPVSEKIEKHLFPGTPVSSSGFFPLLWRGVKISIRNFLLEIIFTIPVLILGFIPVIGIVSSFFLIMIQSYYAGFGNMDYSLERHFGYRESIRFVRKNRGVAIGNGLIFILILMIPFIGFLLVLPFSVTAASLSTLKKINISAVEDV